MPRCYYPFTGNPLTTTSSVYYRQLNTVTVFIPAANHHFSFIISFLPCLALSPLCQCHRHYTHHSQPPTPPPPLLKNQMQGGCFLSLRFCLCCIPIVPSSYSQPIAFYGVRMMNPFREGIPFLASYNFGYRYMYVYMLCVYKYKLYMNNPE